MIGSELTRKSQDKKIRTKSHSRDGPCFQRKYFLKKSCPHLVVILVNNHRFGVHRLKELRTLIDLVFLGVLSLFGARL